MELLNQLRAGLDTFGFNDYVRHLPAVQQACVDAPPVRVAVLRSYTAEPLQPVLTVRLALEGLNPTIWFGGYNQYTREALDPDSGLYDFAPNIVLLMLRIEDVMSGFVDDFPSRSPADWERAINETAHEIASVASRAQQGTAAAVIVQNLTFSQPPVFGMFDAQLVDGQSHLLQKFNQVLAVALEAAPGVSIWDFDALVRAKGHENLCDPKMWYVSHNPYKMAAYPAIVDDLMRYVRGALGRVKKCVVVDLDNTLWGGLAGEDGVAGVRLGHTYPGNCYRDFQKALLNLQRRGILLAIDSKNNEEDAFRIIDEHPDMVLRRKDFAATRINWHDKASNLRELAGELNIGLDSMIFLDDNPAECDLVRRECPQCDVVLLPSKPYLLPALAATLRGAETLRLTDEDRRRSEMYRQQEIRKSAMDEQYTNVDEFLRSLELEVAVDAASSFTIPRIAQLTQKTNQMNMTTRRYTEAQIEALTRDPAHAVFSVRAKDRFGDEGIIGAMILAFEADACSIDTFLLSCRVIGRGIEGAMLAFIAEYARTMGARRLTAEFLPTPRNRPAAGFYEGAGLRRVDANTFEADLETSSFVWPQHLRCTLPGRAAIG